MGGINAQLKMEVLLNVLNVVMEPILMTKHALPVHKLKLRDVKEKKNVMLLNVMMDIYSLR